MEIYVHRDQLAESVFGVENTISVADALRIIRKVFYGGHNLDRRSSANRFVLNYLGYYDSQIEKNDSQADMRHDR